MTRKLAADFDIYSLMGKPMGSPGKTCPVCETRRVKDIKVARTKKRIAMHPNDYPDFDVVTGEQITLTIAHVEFGPVCTIEQEQPESYHNVRRRVRHLILSYLPNCPICKIALKECYTFTVPAEQEAFMFRHLSTWSTPDCIASRDIVVAALRKNGKEGQVQV